jgi:23S rRNA maturation-related 3'-5' exoribonuclease YhaM
MVDVRKAVDKNVKRVSGFQHGLAKVSELKAIEMDVRKAVDNDVKRVSGFQHGLAKVPEL